MENSKKNVFIIRNTQYSRLVYGSGIVKNVKQQNRHGD